MAAAQPSVYMTSSQFNYRPTPSGDSVRRTGRSRRMPVDGSARKVSISLASSGLMAARSIGSVFSSSVTWVGQESNLPCRSSWFTASLDHQAHPTRSRPSKLATSWDSHLLTPEETSRIRESNPFRHLGKVTCNHYTNTALNCVRLTGIEPALAGWKPAVLPKHFNH